MAEAAIDDGAQIPEGDDVVTDGLPDAAPVEGAPADKGVASLVDTPADDDVATAPQATWPDDWQMRLAGEDKAAQNVLKRFASPETLAKAFVDLRKQQSAGQLVKALAPDAKPEEVSAWRAQNGIPESADKYELDLDGRVLPEDDGEIVSGFLEAAHNANFPPQFVNTALQWYADLAENQVAQQIETDKAYQTEAIEELRADWGAQYRANLNSVKTFLGDLEGTLLSARGPDGQILGNNPAVLKQIAEWATQLNPASTISGLGTPDLQGITTEITKIEAEMRRGDGGQYYGGPKDANGETAMQVRYRQLLEAQDRMK